MKKINFPLGFLFFLITGPGTSKAVMHKKPEIWLNSYMTMDSYRATFPDSRFRSQNQFEDYFISKTGSVYVVSPDITAVSFSCEAEYPITWTFPFPEQLEDVNPVSISSADYRISELDPDSSSGPFNLRFKSKAGIILSDENFFSANLSCDSKEIEPQIGSSVYIYLTGKSSMEYEGETLHVLLKPSSSVNGTTTSELSPLELPCRPASPTMKLLLEKEDSTSNNNVTTWNPVQLSSDDDLSFDPKKGFTLQRGLLGDRIFGVYRCSVLDDGNAGEVTTNQFVIVNVTQDTSNDNIQTIEEMPFESKSNIHGKASVNLEMHFEHDLPPVSKIRCCSGVKDKPPTLNVQYCLSPLECQRLIEAFPETDGGAISDEHLESENDQSRFGNTSSDCSVEVLFAASTLVKCQGENVEFAEQFFNLFHPLAGGPVINRTENILKAGQIESGSLFNVTYHPIISLSQFESSDNMNTVVTGQKMIIIFGASKIIKSKQTKKSIGPGIEFGPHHSDVNIVNYSEENELPIFEDETVALKRKLKRYIQVLEYDRDEFYEGEPIVSMCFGLGLYYSRGAHLRLNWLNDTRTVLDPESYNNSVGIPEKKRGHILYLRGKADMFEGFSFNLISIFGTTVIARQGMKSVDCWMPLRNSSGWDMISKSVQVLPSESPSFIEKEEETVYFYLGDVGQKVTCTLKLGRPFPRVVVTRDGRRQKLRLNESAAETKKRLERAGKNETRDTKSMNEKKNFLIIKINFPTIAHTHQGEISCTASNVNGTATRTVKVFVLEKAGKALPVVLSIVGILCLLLIGLGAKHWHKRSTSSLQTILHEHVNSVQSP